MIRLVTLRANPIETGNSSSDIFWGGVNGLNRVVKDAVSASEMAGRYGS